MIFELPVVLVLLASIGIVTPEILGRFRRHAIVVLAVLSAMLTPADPWTMMMMMAPLVLLYELSIWLIRVLVRPDRRREETPEGEGSPA